MVPSQLSTDERGAVERRLAGRARSPGSASDAQASITRMLSCRPHSWRRSRRRRSSRPLPTGKPSRCSSSRSRAGAVELERSICRVPAPDHSDRAHEIRKESSTSRRESAPNSACCRTNKQAAGALLKQPRPQSADAQRSVNRSSSAKANSRPAFNRAVRERHGILRDVLELAEQATGDYIGNNTARLAGMLEPRS